MNNCKVCNYNEKIQIYNNFKYVSSDIQKVKYRTNFFICTKCGCLQKKINASYIPNIKKIYKNYQGFQKYGETDQKKIINGNITDRCFLLYKKYLNKKKYKNILDFGSGNGAMLMPFDNTNKNLYATDLKNNLNYKILKAKNFKKFFSSKDLIKSKKKYDLITMIHVLEHLEDPRKILLSLSKKLEKNGIIFIQIPNFLLNYYDLCVYDHTIHFDHFSLQKLAELSNLKIIKLDDSYIHGEYSIILKKTKKKTKTKITTKVIQKLIVKKTKILKQIDNFFLKINKINKLSILGSSISSLSIANNYNGKINSFYDEDISKINKKIENITIKKLNINETDNLFLPFCGKKLIIIKNRLKKNYKYKLKCFN